MQPIGDELDRHDGAGRGADTNTPPSYTGTGVTATAPPLEGGWPDAATDPGPAAHHVPDRAREYEELKNEFRAEGRYPGREEEVAARIVNKQRREFGETRAARGGPEAAPLENYPHLTVPEIITRIGELPLDQVKAVKRYEEAHRRRKTLLVRLERYLRERDAEYGDLSRGRRAPAYG